MERAWRTEERESAVKPCCSCRVFSYHVFLSVEHIFFCFSAVSGTKLTTTACSALGSTHPTQEPVLVKVKAWQPLHPYVHVHAMRDFYLRLMPLFWFHRMASYYSFLLSLRLQLSLFNLVLHQAYLNAGRDEMDLATSASHIDLQGMAREAAAGNNKQANKIKIALSLYKVQQNIYLLDFQRVEVREHTVSPRIHPSIHPS